MKTIIIGIDGLEMTVIQKYINELPNFNFLFKKGLLKRVKSIFPADSVPAWNTIFTGLDPSEHGIIRGKDYIESIDDFTKLHTFNLRGKTFWDKISSNGKKVLILNPFLAYPPWKVNGIFASGPAFIKGETKTVPETVHLDHGEVFGGYEPINKDGLVEDINQTIIYTELLWKTFYEFFKKERYDLSFVTFTTLDRVQHYTWRYFDKNDPLYSKHPILSDSILKMLKLFDNYIGQIIQEMSSDDVLTIISDHGFSQRPYDLINLNEVLRLSGLLKIRKGDNVRTKYVQKAKNVTIKILSKVNLLDIVVSKVKNIESIKKLKKSDYLIDQENSMLYVDALFCGKKPYCGFNVGNKFRNNLTEKKKSEIKQRILKIFEVNKLPKPLWIKWNDELYKGKYYSNYPDLCFELPSKYGIEFELFGSKMTNSATHYKISGGHLNDGVYAFYNKTGQYKGINSIVEFYDLIIALD